MSQQQTDYDIVIAGGGMIGTCLALALAPLGLSIAVVEAVARKALNQPSFDDRSTALARSSQRMFEAMGLWDEIVAAATPIRSIHVSDKGRFGFSRIDANEQGVEALGYIVINRVLGAVLQSRLASSPRVDLFCPARIIGVEPNFAATAVSVRTDEAEPSLTLSCKLLVAADGAGSTVRGLLGIEAQQTDYGQHAIVGNLSSELDPDNRAFERFTAQGPLALLPIAERRSAFVWTVSSHDAQRVLALNDVEFLTEIQSEFGFRLGRFSRVGTRAAYPLTLSKALRVVASRSVLVGNAAHGLHPVSAQGFNLGLRDVAALCDCIADECARMSDGEDQCTDFASATMLQRYAEWRREDQRKLVHFTDNLVRLFGSSRPPVRVLRDIAMVGFDLIPGVRSLFAKHTMGLAGKLPRLSRGMPIQ